MAILDDTLPDDAILFDMAVDSPLVWVAHSMANE